MIDFILAAVLLALVGAAIRYVVNAKKSGAACIGCPVDGGCARNPDNGSGCCCGCRANKS